MIIVIASSQSETMLPSTTKGAMFACYSALHYWYSLSGLYVDPIVIAEVTGDRLILVVDFLVVVKIVTMIVVEMVAAINTERNDLAKLTNLLHKHYGDKIE